MFATSILYPEYSGYLKDFLGVSSLVVIRPIFIALYILFYVKYINFKRIEERVWFNSVILLLIFTILSVQFGPFQRFTYFLLPYITLLIPLIASRIVNKKERFYHIAIVVTIMISYVVLTNLSLTTDYSFIWQGNV